MKEKMSISYDKDADVMYIGFGEKSKGVSEEVEEGVFARYHYITGNLIGLTIINFSKKFGQKPKRIAISSYH